MILDDERYGQLLEARARHPEQIEEAAKSRSRRRLLEDDGRLVIIAMDHPARRIVKVGSEPLAMADRRQVLENTIRALRRPGVDGLLASPDILEDLLLLGELDEKVVFGSMNRGGLTNSSWELDDRFTGHDASTIDRLGLDGGKMLLRILDEDPGTINTIEGCARAVTELASRRLVALVEPLPVTREADGRLRVSDDPAVLAASVGVASALGATSAYTWLKLPAPEDPATMLAATTLPTLLLGGDPGARSEALFDRWREALAMPQVRGLVAGRSLIFPPDGDVERATDAAVALVHGDLS